MSFMFRSLFLLPQRIAAPLLGFLPLPAFDPALYLVFFPLLVQRLLCFCSHSGFL